MARKTALPEADGPASTVEVQADSIYEALVEFHRRCPPIAHDERVEVATRAGGKYSYTYASLAAIMTAIRPVLAECGLFVSFAVQSESGKVGVEARLHHRSGQFLSSGWLMADVVAGERQEGIKALGSVVQYLRRYALNVLLALTPEQDDDGTHSVEAARPQPPAEKAQPEPQPTPAASDTELVELVQAVGRHGVDIASRNGREQVLKIVNAYLRTDYARFRDIPRGQVLSATHFFNGPTAPKWFERYQQGGAA